MGAEESIHITVLIAGRPYPLKVKTADEPVVRKLVKQINDQVNQFQLSYNQKDKQDCLAMALLTFAVNAQKEQSAAESANLSPLEDKIDQIDQLLVHGV
ncbi:MAG: cell division protein ZapA [Bacteroidota bacterium]